MYGGFNPTWGLLIAEMESQVGGRRKLFKFADSPGSTLVVGKAVGGQPEVLGIRLVVGFSVRQKVGKLDIRPRGRHNRGRL